MTFLIPKKLSKTTASPHSLSPMKIAMFVKLTKMIGGSSSGPPTLVLTRKSTSPVVTMQLGSPASLASDKKENISQLLGTGHFVVEVVKVTLLGKVGRMVDSSGVLNSCADISFTSVKRGMAGVKVLL